ncbi:MAG: hypothetical protein B6D55_05650 [Candidatus Omnitrophica bacterium 4484_70.2]|nr:MAG: hypothetical protein B6D55_05650 [Candidatus Omnitrophica bacterium 4484_70.2]
MIRPASMTLVKILILKEDLERVSQKLIELGFMEIEKATNFLEYPQESLLNVEEIIEKATNLLERISNISKIIQVKKKNASIEERLKISLDIPNQINQEFASLEGEVNYLIENIKDYQNQIQSLETISFFLSWIEDLGLSLKEINSGYNLCIKKGIIKREVIDTFQNNITFECAYKLKIFSSQKAFLLCACLKEDENKLKELFKGFEIEEIELEDTFQNIKDFLDNIEIKIWQLKEEVANFKMELKKIREKFQDTLIYWTYLLKQNIKIYNSMQNFLSTKMGYCIIGWVPTENIRILRENITDICRKNVEIEEIKAEELIREGFAPQKVPSFLKHPFLLKPFQILVKFYGYPAYLHVDPTLFMAISFLIMFGIMFADVGHGLVLFIAGIIIQFFKKSGFLKDFGKILIYAGVSSCIFGFLFGSFFGREEVFKPLWFYPLHNPQKFMLLGIIIGIIMISTGIILNVLQRIWQKNLKEAFFSEWGILSISFYWMCIYLVASSFRYPTINMNWWMVSILILVPLSLIVFGDIWFLKKAEKKYEHRDLSTIVFKPMEIMLGLLTNTVSFVRVAAFGLTHAALMSSVYMVSDTLGKLPFLKESIITEGNIFVIILEGLIVFIQCLRLEFYEFFSKFFYLEGRPFKPLRI